MFLFNWSLSPHAELSHGLPQNIEYKVYNPEGGRAGPGRARAGRRWGEASEAGGRRRASSRRRHRQRELEEEEASEFGGSEYRTGSEEDEYDGEGISDPARPVFGYKYNSRDGGGGGSGRDDQDKREYKLRGENEKHLEEQKPWWKGGSHLDASWGFAEEPICELFLLMKRIPDPQLRPKF